MNTAGFGAPVRVLHIIGRMDRAGAETMVMNLYREMDRLKFQFDFVYFTDAICDYDAEIEGLGGEIHRIAVGNVFSRFFALWQLLRGGQWSIVHAHTLFSSGLHLSAARLAGVPHRVAHSHNTHDANSTSFAGRMYQRLMRGLLAWAPTSYVACGLAAANYLFPGRSDVTVIPNAIDIDRFASASGAGIRKQLGLADDCLAILQVGRFMPVKNHARSVDIAARLRDTGKNFRMLLIGAGPEQRRVEKLVADRGLQECALFLGLRADIPELMAAADVMLMPSLHEGFPVVLVEAQAAGLPSVVSGAVSNEVDLGMGMVRFVDLAVPNANWVNALTSAARDEVPDIGMRTAELERAGFSASSGARRLERLYCAP